MTGPNERRQQEANMHAYMSNEDYEESMRRARERDRVERAKKVGRGIKRKPGTLNP